MSNQTREYPSYIIVLDGKQNKFYHLQVNEAQMRLFWDFYKAKMKEAAKQ